MGKIAIVGVEGSGKTVLMAGLSECYQQTSDEGPYLMPENQSAFMFMQRIPHKLRVKREWPEQTRIDSLRMMKWTLRFGQEILQEIEILDYPGELYRIAFGEHTQEEADAVRSELDEFLKHLTDAETLVVLLNLADLDDLANNPRNAETVWITRGIFDFARKLPNLKHKMLVFTQADRYAEEIHEAGGAKALYSIKLPMLKALYPDLRVSVVSVVDGMDAEGRPKEGYSVAGCYEFMRGVLVEENKQIIEASDKCDALCQKLKEFASGGPKDFDALVKSYCSAYDELRTSVKPLCQLYYLIVKENYKRVNVYFELNEAIMKFVKEHSTKQLADVSIWAGPLGSFKRREIISAAFGKYYREKIEEEKRDNRFVWIMLGVILLFIVVIIGFGFLASPGK